MTDQLLKENNRLLQRMIDLLMSDKCPVADKKEAKAMLGIDDDKKFYWLVKSGLLKPIDTGRDKYDKKEVQEVFGMIKNKTIRIPKK